MDGRIKCGEREAMFPITRELWSCLGDDGLELEVRLRQTGYDGGVSRETFDRIMHVLDTGPSLNIWCSRHEAVSAVMLGKNGRRSVIDGIGTEAEKAVRYEHKRRIRATDVSLCGGEFTARMILSSEHAVRAVSAPCALVRLRHRTSFGFHPTRTEGTEGQFSYDLTRVWTGCSLEALLEQMRTGADPTAYEVEIELTDMAYVTEKLPRDRAVLSLLLKLTDLTDAVCGGWSGSGSGESAAPAQQ